MDESATLDLHRAFTDPNEFVLSKIVDRKNVRRFMTETSDDLKTKLAIFQFGLWRDYCTARRSGQLTADLTPAETSKLQLLTVGRLARGRTFLTFDEIQTGLDLGDPCEAPRICQRAMDHGSIVGLIDFEKKLVEIHQALVGDINEEHCDWMVATFDDWLAKIDECLAEGEGKCC